MSSTKTRLAVLIPAYNAEQTLDAALASLAANGVPHDIVIVDDASRKPVRDTFALPANVTVLRFDKNRGVTCASNHGLRYILDRDYDYIARLDADDTATADRLALQIAFMDQHPNVALLGGSGQVVSEQGDLLFYLNLPADPKMIAKKLFYNCCLSQPTFMFRAEALRGHGLYDESYPNAEDYELVRRYARHAEIANLPNYLVSIMVRADGISVSKRKEQLQQRLRVQWQYRDFASIHFYLGVLKTLALWCMPVVLIRIIKRRMPGYNKAK